MELYEQNKNRTSVSGWRNRVCQESNLIKKKGGMCFRTTKGPLRGPCSRCQHFYSLLCFLFHANFFLPFF